MDHRHDHHDDSEDINEWQQIEQQPWNTVVVNENYLKVHVDQFSSTEDPPAPTHHHEGSLETVPITTTANIEDGASSPSASSAESVTAETPPPPSDWRVRVANEGRKLLKLRLEAVRNGVVMAASRVRECAVCVGAFWSVTCVAGVAAVVLVAVAYVGIRRRRKVDRRLSAEHLVHLLREKDEKISQLVLEIAQMNQVLSSRRKVQVLRMTNS